MMAQDLPSFGVPMRWLLCLFSEHKFISQGYYFDGRTEWDTFCARCGAGWHGRS